MNTHYTRMTKTQESNHFYFAGFATPNYTSVPDELFDALAPELSEAELRVLLYIVRRTFGFKKESDAISVSQMVNGITTRAGVRLDRGTGLSRRGVINGCNGLVAKGVVTVSKRRTAKGDSDVNVYRLRFRSDDGVVHQMHGGSAPDAPPVVHEMHPQETVSQDTEKQETVLSISSKSVRTKVLHAENAKRQVHDQSSFNPTGRGGAEAEHRSQAPMSLTPTGVRQSPVGEGLSAVRDLLRSRLPQRLPVAPERAKTERSFSKTGSSSSQPQTSRESRPRSAGDDTDPVRRRGDRVEAPPYLAATLDEVSKQLHDAHPESSLTRAVRLWQTSGLAEDAFVGKLYGARSITRQQPRVRRGMPYFFAVVEDLVGTKALALPPVPGPGAAVDEHRKGVEEGHEYTSVH